MKLEEVARTPNAETPDFTAAIAIVEAGVTPSDFTEEYDRAVDTVEDQLIQEGLDAMRAFRTDLAQRSLARVASLRDKHLALLDAAAETPDHPLASSLQKLRDFAVESQSIVSWLTQLTQAMDFWHRGEGERAIEVLDVYEAPSVEVIADPRATSMMVSLAQIAGEMLAAEIRASVRDYGGARSAFGRSVAGTEALAQTMEEHVPGSAASLAHQLALAESGALRMQLAQLLQAHEYASAADIANQAGEKLAAAAEQMVAFDPPSGSLLAPLLTASSEEHFAKMEAAYAEVALEQSNWENAETHSQLAGYHFDAAARVALRSTLPAARLAQEQYLNSGFNFGVQFRRRMERERQAKESYENVQQELRTLYSSIRGALAPAGVTFNNTTEMVTTVQQRVEIVNRIEERLRGTLREVPEALLSSGLSETKAESLAAEATELADSGESGPQFFERFKAFASRLASATSKSAELAAPIVAVLQALSLVP